MASEGKVKKSHESQTNVQKRQESHEAASDVKYRREKTGKENMWVITQTMREEAKTDISQGNSELSNCCQISTSNA